MPEPLTIVWFRADLRISDNPALIQAAERGRVLPVYIWAPEEEGDWAPGGAKRWWLHHSLSELRESLRGLGADLIIRKGPSADELKAVIDQSGADAVFWNRRYEPAILSRDEKVRHFLRNDCSVMAKSFNSHLLHEPWTVQTQSGGPYQVFTPFNKALQKQPRPDLPLDPPEKLRCPSQKPKSASLESLELEPKRDWKDGLADAWQPGEKGAAERLEAFLGDEIRQYEDARNVPADDGTSRLSPHLHLGEISVRQCFHAVRKFMGDGRRKLSGQEKDQCGVYLTELCWREFAYHVLYHFPKTPESPLREKYADFPWENDAAALKKWQKGQTGYPIIDAGMRQLWATGWMHNRVRMIVASFLVKDLLISWEEGAAWFWDTLVDADLANNTLGWQWAGGCGADAAPYFRIFNPVLQGKKFDGDGRYVRRWVPELKDLPDRWLHEPWKAKPEVLKKAGVDLGENYPRPVVDHKEARKSALSALDEVKG